MTDLAPLTEAECKQFVDDWYQLLDVHAPVEDVLPLLADEELKLVFPEVTEYKHAGFRTWYEKVTNLFFDEVHNLVELNITPAGDHADVKLLVNWQCKIWNPPAAKSEWLGFNAGQTWVLKRSPKTEKPMIVTYTVDTFDPMEGSGSL